MVLLTPVCPLPNTSTRDNNSVFCLLSAILAEVQCDPPSSLQNFEAAMDHGELHESVLDEAFAHEMYAEWLMRKKANRAARHSLRDCIATYRRISAFGKANHVATKYEWLLRSGTSVVAVDAGCQTTVIDTNNTSFRLRQNDDHRVSQVCNHW